MGIGGKLELDIISTLFLFFLRCSMRQIDAWWKCCEEIFVRNAWEKHQYIPKIVTGYAFIFTGLRVTQDPDKYWTCEIHDISISSALPFISDGLETFRNICKPWNNSFFHSPPLSLSTSLLFMLKDFSGAEIYTAVCNQKVKSAYTPILFSSWKNLRTIIYYSAHLF